MLTYTARKTPGQARNARLQLLHQPSSGCSCSCQTSRLRQADRCCECLSLKCIQTRRLLTFSKIESRMRRFVHTGHQQYQQQAFTLGIPYGSHYASVANTPPPLTADTQSLQSSTIPSVNGDAVEGAQSFSRKESDPLSSAATLR